MNVSSCRSCGADIVWFENPKTGRKMPVNAESVDRKGRIAFDDPFALKRTNPKQDNMLVIWEPPLPAPWRFD